MTVEKLMRWEAGLDPLVAESRALPGVPPEEARKFQSWVDWMVDRMRHRELAALVARDGDAPVGLAGYQRKGHVTQVSYLYLREDHDEPLSAFLRKAENYWRPAHRIVIRGGPQTLLDEALGAEGFLDAGYERFERARLMRCLKEPIRVGPDPDIIPLPIAEEEALARLQVEGYAGSPDAMLIDDMEAMTMELLADPWLSPETSFAVRQNGRLVAALYTFHKGPLAWIASVCVDPAARGQGLARRLMCHALGAYRAAGFERAGLHVTLSNRPAIALYEQLGFTLSERLSLLYARNLEEYS
jgi:ribosomal protein S18 acetylase RimI-like enzyme